MDLKTYRNKIQTRNPKVFMAFMMARAVEQMRATAGFSQEELAKKVKTTQSSIARMESGKHEPSLSNLFKIARATNHEMIPPTFMSPLVEVKK